ncbi:MAG: hypothetical protein Q7S86_04075 [bacterium]|nr:hypothetical protein [bacterium]
MSNNKGFALIIIVFIVVSVLTLGGGTYHFLAKDTPESAENPTLTPSPAPITTSAPTDISNNVPSASAGKYGIRVVPMPAARPAVTPSPTPITTSAPKYISNNVPSTSAGEYSVSTAPMPATPTIVTTQDTVAGISTQILNLQERLNNTTDVLVRNSLTSQITELKARMEALAKALQSKVTITPSASAPTVPITTNSNLATDCNRNKFSAAFVLVSPDPSDQKTKEFSNFLEDLQGKFEQAFKDATYGLATMKVEDIFITKTGSEDYIDNPSQIVLSNVTKDLIAKNGDKYDLVYVFTNYDPKTNAWFYVRSRSFIKNIGFIISNNSTYYGSFGKLLGVAFMGDFLSEYKNSLNEPRTLASRLPTDAPWGMGLLLHETGHQWCCQLGDKFSGNGDTSKVEIIAGGSHTYRGLEAPAKTQDPMFGSLPWVLDENSGTYFLEKATTIAGFGTNADYADFGFNWSMDFAYEHYPIRYHPVTLYAMGLLPKDQYSKEFNIVDIEEEVGNSKVTDAKKYSKTSVNDIIKIFGERTCNQ